MMQCTKRTNCRVCGGDLVEVLGLGEQALGGQFPYITEPDPPAFPIVLCRCAGPCGLAQLEHTIDPDLLYKEYYYRSGISNTMRNHLLEIVQDAFGLLGREPIEGVLDIACNDGTLLSYVPKKYTRIGIDPCDIVEDVVPAGRADHVLRKRFPCDLGGEFDLIFTIACFYDADDPVAFARCVKDHLTLDGLWVIEVANLHDMIVDTGYDSICHEHLCYYDPSTIMEVMKRAGLRVVQTSFNRMNGGSLRVTCCRQESERHSFSHQMSMTDASWLEQFAMKVAQHSMSLVAYLRQCREERLTVHLLGASTKANTLLQLAGVGPELIQAASERDDRKLGRVCPGSRIPIISETESRMLRPDVYLTVLGHFKQELIARELEFLSMGGRITFLLPEIKEVRG